VVNMPTASPGEAATPCDDVAKVNAGITVLFEDGYKKLSRRKPERVLRLPYSGYPDSSWGESVGGTALCCFTRRYSSSCQTRLKTMDMGVAAAREIYTYPVVRIFAKYLRWAPILGVIAFS